MSDKTLFQQINSDIERVLSKKRYQHVLRVVDTAVELAEYHQCDIEKAKLAALLHDYAKEMPKENQLELAQAYYSDPQLATYGSAIWHGLAAATLAETKYDISDSDVLQAIAWHTSGWEEMSLLQQIIYTADYIEPGRDFKGVKKVRKLAKKNLAKACFVQMQQTLTHLIKKGAYIAPISFYVYNQWVNNQNEEAEDTSE